MTPRVREILDWYRAENPGVITQLARLLGAGGLGGSGRLALLASSNILTHTPAEKFATNRDSFNPVYRSNMAVELQYSAFCGQKGELELIVPDHAGVMLFILELNQINLTGGFVETAKVSSALKLGCCAVKINLPVSGTEEHISRLLNTVDEARELGLPVVVSGKVNALQGEDDHCLDMLSHFCHLVAQSGVQIIEVAFPGNKLSSKKQEKLYLNHRVKTHKALDQVKHILDSSFNAQRIVLMSVDETLNAEELLRQGKEIARGGGFGTICTSELWHKYSVEEAKELNFKLLALFKTQ